MSVWDERSDEGKEVEMVGCLALPCLASEEEHAVTGDLIIFNYRDHE